MAEAKKRGRPLLGLARRQMISFKVDPMLLECLKLEAQKQKVGYQSLLHQILQEHVLRKPLG
jgi:hypothetical protein